MLFFSVSLGKRLKSGFLLRISLFADEIFVQNICSDKICCPTELTSPWIKERHLQPFHWSDEKFCGTICLFDFH